MAVLIFMGSFYSRVSLYIRSPRGPSFVRSDKGSKTLSSAEVRKNKKSPRSCYLSLGVGQEVSDRFVLHLLLAVIFRFLLCASWVIFTAHLYLKALSTKLTATFSLSQGHSIV